MWIVRPIDATDSRRFGPFDSRLAVGVFAADATNRKDYLCYVEDFNLIEPSLDLVPEPPTREERLARIQEFFAL